MQLRCCVDDTPWIQVQSISTMEILIHAESIFKERVISEFCRDSLPAFSICASCVADNEEMLVPGMKLIANV